MARIRHLGFQIDRQSCERLTLLFPGPDPERCIGKSVSERIQHPVPCDRLKEAVSHVDIFLIDIPHACPEITRGRIILNPFRNRIGQVTGRTDTTGQDIHDAKAADHAALPHVKNRIRPDVIHKPHIDDISGIQQDDHPGECAPDSSEHVQLRLCKQK